MSNTTTPRIVTVSFVRTRHSSNLRVWVDGKRQKDQWAGNNDEARDRARTFVANFAARHNCFVCGETKKWSDSQQTVFTLVFVLATKAAEAAAAQPVAEVAPAAFDPAAPSATKFAVESLCKFAVARGCLLSLSNNSEGIVIEPTDDVAAVLAALAEIGDVCMLTIKRRNPQSAMLSGLDNAGAAWVLPNDGDVCQTDTVSDYSDAPLIEEWAEAFDRRTYN